MAANIKIPAREQEASLHEPATAGIQTDSAAAGCNHTRCVAYASNAMLLFKLLLLWANETEAGSPGGSFTAPQSESGLQGCNVPETLLAALIC